MAMPSAKLVLMWASMTGASRTIKPDVLVGHAGKLLQEFKALLAACEQPPTVKVYNGIRYSNDGVQSCQTQNFLLICDLQGNGVVSLRMAAI